MRTVKYLLETKGYDIYSVSPEASVYEALELLAEKNVGALVVLDQDELVGIISERDYARQVELQGKSARQVPVREIMTEKVICVGPDQSVQECMALMSGRRVRHLPVLKEGRLIGVISIGDVVKNIIAEQEFMIEQLESYISGGGPG